MKLGQLKDVIGKSKKPDFPEHREMVRQIGADSMVLLKNNDSLPIKKGKIALFGAGAVDTVFCGIIYNHVYSKNNVNVKTGLAANGFTFSTESWLNKMEKAAKVQEREDSPQKSLRRLYGIRKYAPEVPISVADMAEAILGTDTCVYVIRRVDLGQTGMDLNAKTYALSEVEQENLNLITSSFKNVIVVLNSALIEIAAVARTKNVKAILLMGLPGEEAGNSLADVLTGAVNPSGRLTDTWAKKYKDYSSCLSPAKIDKSAINNDIDYKEGIYIGYRYFDAFDVTPLYPFGYGLSYTTFDIKLSYFEASWMGVVLRATVTNTGKTSGRQVVQVYLSSPAGKIEKPYQSLCGFAKTGKLKPGESEEVTMKIPLMSLTSFDDETPGWVMEAGDYLFRLGANSRETELVAKIVLDKTTMIKKVVHVMYSQKEFNYIAPPARREVDTGYIKVASLSGDAYNTENKSVALCTEFDTYVPEGSTYTSYINSNPYSVPFSARENIRVVKPCQSATFLDVVRGKVSMEEFVASLSPEILARIIVGDTEESRLESENRFNFNFSVEGDRFQLAARTTSQFENTLGIPGVKIADGPSGLHIWGADCTCFPSPINMAQTWDMGAMNRMGRAYGREMEAYDIDYTLAPALNVHRNPMWQRAYEFYSEDPTLAGVMGAGFVMGVKRYEGRNVILKNLVSYNQETGTADVNINVSRRAFSEIYLRSFSVCQFIAPPAGILNSGNRINGFYTSNHRGLNTDILRNDWGFEGFVMTDWASPSDKGNDIHAGCDLIMPGYNPDKILECMMNVSPSFEADGSVKVVERAIKHGEPMIHYEEWGSFLPDKNGDTQVNTRVEANTAVSDKVLRMEKQGICTIKMEADGSMTISYKGYNRGPYLALGELQQSVMHILGEIKNTASMKKLMERASV